MDALLHHGGVQRFRTGEELFNAAEFYDRQPLPLRTPDRDRHQLSRDGDTGGRCLRNPRPARRAGPRPGPEPARDAYSRRLPGLRDGPSARILRDAGRRRADGVLRRSAGWRSGWGSRGDLQNPLPGRASPSWRASSPPRVSCPPAQTGGVPNFRFPEYCADVLARAAERRAWLSRPLGERPHYEDLDPAAARELIGSASGSGAERGSMAGERRGGGSARNARRDCRALSSVRGHRRRGRDRRADRRADRAEGRSSAAGLRRRHRRGAAWPARRSSGPSRLAGARAPRAADRAAMDGSGRAAADATGCRCARRHGYRSGVRAGDGGRARRPSRRAPGHRRLPPSPEHRHRRATS